MPWFPEIAEIRRTSDTVNDDLLRTSTVSLRSMIMPVEGAPQLGMRFPSPTGHTLLLNDLEVPQPAQDNQEAPQDDHEERSQPVLYVMSFQVRIHLVRRTTSSQ